MVSHQRVQHFFLDVLIYQVTQPVLQFRHHMCGADIGAIRVQWVQVGENFWSNPMSPYAVTLADEKDPWSHYELDLCCWQYHQNQIHCSEIRIRYCCGHCAR